MKGGKNISNINLHLKGASKSFGMDEMDSYLTSVLKLTGTHTIPIEHVPLVFVCKQYL